jgi:hypothetical protein
MGKLTPTFREQQAANGGIHIEPPHEPLRGEVFTPNKVTISPPEREAARDSVIDPAPVAEPAPLKVALIGTAPSSRMLAPFNDPTWQIWACSPGNQGQLPRVDVWFELHGNLHWPENASYGLPYIEWLKTLRIPVYMQNQSYVPNAVVFPKDEMVKEFGRDFFTSSFSWMMALAIHKGAKEIALYGIDMASRDEYILQRPGFYFFKHIAEQRGIRVSAPHESDIMQPPGLYGFSEVTPFGRKVLAREKELRDRVAAMEAQQAQINNSVTYLKGALEDLDYIKSIWLGQG